MFNYQDKLNEMNNKLTTLKGFENAIEATEKEILILKELKETDPNKLVENQLKLRELENKLELLKDEASKIDLTVITQEEANDYMIEKYNTYIEAKQQLYNEFIVGFDKLLNDYKTKHDKVHNVYINEKLKISKELKADLSYTPSTGDDLRILKEEIKRKM